VDSSSWIGDGLSISLTRQMLGLHAARMRAIKIPEMPKVAGFR